MSYSSLIVAQRFLELADSNDDRLTVMQLLKLVYIAHGWMLGLFGKPLIDDDIEAWKYGPVIPRLYQNIKHYRDKPVDKIDLPLISDEELSIKESELIKTVYLHYRDESNKAMAGIDLSSLTHKKGTPWDEVYRDDQANIRISNDLIELYYRRHLRELIKKAGLEEQAA